MKTQNILIAAFLIIALAATAHYFQTDKLATIQSAIAEEDADWTAGVTSVSHLSAAEKKHMCGAKYSPPPPDAVIVSRPIAAPANPQSFDWRDKDGENWMTPVKSQGTCGSCWVFATHGVLEAIANIEANDPKIDPDLSEQYFVSSCYIYGDCKGGWPDHVFDRIRMYGAPLEECDEYKGYDSSCVCTGWYPDGVYYSIGSRKYIYSSTENFKWALQEYGPLVVTLNIKEDWFYYVGGVYEPVWSSEEFGANAAHAVVLIGWNDTENCWIVKNSYDVGWGEEGYGRVLHGNLEQYDYVYTVDGVEYPDVIPPSSAQIEPYTDTFTTDKSVYSPGETITMTAWGENVGDMRWDGVIQFTVRKPDGLGFVERMEVPDVIVYADDAEYVSYSWVLPISAIDGTWSIESTWYANNRIDAINKIPFEVLTISGAQIDDSTDTLTFNKSTYQLGDTVTMYAIGTNIGDETWNGNVQFIITDPNGNVRDTLTDLDVTVPSGTDVQVSNHYTLPSDAASGTWTIQSIWTDDDGVIHAYTMVTL